MRIPGVANDDRSLAIGSNAYVNNYFSVYYTKALGIISSSFIAMLLIMSSVVINLMMYNVMKTQT